MKVNEKTGRIIFSAGEIILLLSVIFMTANPLPAQQENKPEPDNRLVVNTDLITLNVSVTTAEGQAVGGLDKNAFTVFDNQKQQEISFFSNADKPASVAIVFDTSGSISEGKMAQAKAALAQLIQTSKEDDEFFLVGFNSRPELLLDSTRDPEAVLNKLKYFETRGNTALFDAVNLGLDKVIGGTRSRKILIVISDGEDNNSRLSLKELRRRLRESEATIYTVGVGGYLGSEKGRMNPQMVMDELAKASGGRAFFPGSMIEMDEIFEKISLEMRHFYSIGYYPTDFTADGNKRRVKVRLIVPENSPRLVVRHREIYYAGSKR